MAERRTTEFDIIRDTLMVYTVLILIAIGACSILILVDIDHQAAKQCEERGK